MKITLRKRIRETVGTLFNTYIKRVERGDIMQHSRIADARKALNFWRDRV